MPARRVLLSITLAMSLLGGALVSASPGRAEEATPEATPVASPVASPQGTPEATPEGTPEATPVTGAGARLDLAAMALASDDVPAEVSLEYEQYVTATDVASAVSDESVPPEKILATGLLWYYESQYASADRTIRIRSYVEEYATEQGAAAGFDILEDETRLVSTDAAFIDRPAPADLGEEPREITIGTFPDPQGGGRLEAIDITFRVGRLLGGVSLETVEGVQPDRQLALELARRLEERMRAVLDGTPLPGIDPTLPQRLVPAAPGTLGLQEGYVSIGEVFGSEAAGAIGSEYRSGYLRTDVYDYERGEALPLPLLSIAVTSFASEAAPLAILTNADLVTPPYTNLERVRLDRIPGTSAVVGFRYTNPYAESADAPIDSFHILMIVENSVVIIDVQGAGSAKAAQDAAVLIASRQAGCIRSDEPCTAEPLAAEFLTAAAATPGAGG
ncbi:MAG: hypothetical protein KatS3mg059_1510 [Thermomicrobiales bacterium]|nr:MAG: hypothetical protein KatS3mg059_1510 [Thermomicrobiales bacterium]